jgi:hypothetical protein
MQTLLQGRARSKFFFQGIGIFLPNYLNKTTALPFSALTLYIVVIQVWNKVPYPRQINLNIFGKAVSFIKYKFLITKYSAAYKIESYSSFFFAF